MKFKGRVGKGDGRGRKIAFPTINLALQDIRSDEFEEFFCGSVRIKASRMEKKRKVNYGVYLVKVDGMPAVMHFGPLPTFKKNLPRVEIHILDFEGDLYGKEVTIEVFEKIRDVKKFENVKELAEAIQADVEMARKKFS